jgi:hypothetical protein
VFVDEWGSALAHVPKGLRPLKYFRMREAFRCRDEFHRWSATQRDAKVEELVGIIKNVAECQIVASMSKRLSVSAFRRFATTVEASLRNPICASVCRSQVMSCAEAWSA